MDSPAAVGACLGRAAWQEAGRPFERSAERVADFRLSLRRLVRSIHTVVGRKRLHRMLTRFRLRGVLIAALALLIFTQNTFIVIEVQSSPSSPSTTTCPVTTAPAQRGSGAEAEANQISMNKIIMGDDKKAKNDDTKNSSSGSEPFGKEGWKQVSVNGIDILAVTAVTSSWFMPHVNSMCF
jgi:hypothetical protein